MMVYVGALEIERKWQASPTAAVPGHSEDAGATGQSGGWDMSQVRLSISTPVGVVGTITLNPDATENMTARTWFLKDHLGSIWKELKDVDLGGTQATVGLAFSNDAWGQRRSHTDWSSAGLGTYAVDFSDELNPVVLASSSADPDPSTRRGFTGHEILDEVGLVHMNGRIYDPTLGRFLSADPFVQEEGNLQSYNRYSYVINNPISVSDPSGYFFKQLFSVFVAILVTFITAGALTGLVLLGSELLGGIAAGAIAGFAGGFAGGLASGGGLSGALRGGLMGALSGAAAGAIGGGFGHDFGGDVSWGSGWEVEVARAMSHGISQGAVSEAFGGDFMSGFLGGISGSLVGSIQGAPGFQGTDLGQALGTPGSGTWQQKAGRTAMAAVAGGSVAEIGGGNFANGAFSAAMSHLVNAEGGDWLDKLSDFSAGFGDTISFGLTRKIRDSLSFYDGTVDYESGFYEGGEYSATALETLQGGRGLIKAFGKKGFKVMARETGELAARNIDEAAVAATKQAAKNARKMTNKDIAKFLGDPDWHKAGYKQEYINAYRSQLKGSTNADFFLNNKTGQVFLKGNEGGAMVEIGKF